MTEPLALSAELSAMAAALQASHRTGYTVPVVQLLRFAARALELERQLLKEGEK